MQTFLPYSDFEKCAKSLDYRRLGKQRVECLQILDTLVNNKKAWSNHPAVKMWKGYETGLCKYALEICREWIVRGYKDTCYDKIVNNYGYLLVASGSSKINFNPPWLGDEKLHSSHRAALLFKKEEYYQKFDWLEKPELNYYWPQNK